jgi:hypothetical protein
MEMLTPKAQAVQTPSATETEQRNVVQPAREEAGEVLPF